MGVNALTLHFVLLLICGGFRGLQCFFLQTILKRCQSYDASENPELRNRDCSKIVEAFKGAFVSKDPCGITERDYAPLLQLTDQNVPDGKVLLWSNTKGEKQQYSQKKGLLTLENMLLGHLADGLTWCGEKGSPEIDTTSCPDRNSCKGNPVSVFWDTASKWVSTCSLQELAHRGISHKAAANRSSLTARSAANQLLFSPPQWLLPNPAPLLPCSSANPRMLLSILSLSQSLPHAFQLAVTQRRGEYPQVLGISTRASLCSSDSCSDKSISELSSALRGKGIGFACQDVYSSEEIPLESSAPNLSLSFVTCLLLFCYFFV